MLLMLLFVLRMFDGVRSEMLMVLFMFLSLLYARSACVSLLLVLLTQYTQSLCYYVNIVIVSHMLISYAICVVATDHVVVVVSVVGGGVVTCRVCRVVGVVGLQCSR